MLLLASQTPGFLIYLAYKQFWPVAGIRLGLTHHNKDLSILIGTFSFSMLGFLATVITIIIALSDRLHIKTYSRKGHMKEFLFFYLIAIGNLFVVFLMSVWNLGKNSHPLLFDMMLVFFINTLAETALIGLVIFNLLLHSVDRKT